MTAITRKTALLMDILPEADQNFVYEFIKKLVKARDPDYTKVMPQEARKIAEAEASGFIADAEYRLG